MRTNTISAGDFFSNFYSTVGDLVIDGAKLTNGYSDWSPSVTWTTTYPELSRTYRDDDLVFRDIREWVKQQGTPWDAVSSFPPFNVDMNSKDGSVRFRFALAGVDPDTVNIEFNDGKIWLIIDEQPEAETDWVEIKHKLKDSVKGKYFYSMDLEKFDYQSATAKWQDGILEVVIPINEDQKPYRLKIKR